MEHYTSKGFYMEINSDKDLEFAKKYTKEKSENQEKEELLKFLEKIKHRIEIKEDIYYLRLSSGEDIPLSEEEIFRMIGCLKCDKVKINNWARYCSSDCPYYFNTDNLKKIFLGGY